MNPDRQPAPLPASPASPPDPVPALAGANRLSIPGPLPRVATNDRVSFTNNTDAGGVCNREAAAH